jgi:adenine/guanine phosphoribosyltransferase-like PRPP-binding protein
MGNANIYGRQAKADDVHDFKKRKMALKDLGYPKKETQALVDEYLEKVMDKFEPHLDGNTVLVTVPSGSGRNLVTALLAKKLAKEFKCTMMPLGVAAKTHNLESKHALSLDKRLKDPIGYFVDGEEARKHITPLSNVVIVDDVVGTGESAVRLKQALEREGISVAGIASLITIDRNYPTANDINRLVNKLTALAPAIAEKKENLIKDVVMAFCHYTRQRINRLERVLNSEKAALTAFSNIGKAAEMEINMLPRRNEIQQIFQQRTQSIGLSV